MRRNTTSNQEWNFAAIILGFFSYFNSPTTTTPSKTSTTMSSNFIHGDKRSRKRAIKTSWNCNKIKTYKNRELEIFLRASFIRATTSRISFYFCFEMILLSFMFFFRAFVLQSVALQIKLIFYFNKKNIQQVN